MVGVSGGVMVGLLLGIVATVFLLASIRRKKSSRGGLVIGKKHCQEQTKMGNVCVQTPIDVGANLHLLF